jgi:hypothetical protein
MHFKCLFLQQITALFYSNNIKKRPLLNILSSLKLIKPRDHNSFNCQAAFKGASALAASKDVKMQNKNLPSNLCLL